jgi:hypothetical protein
MVMMMMMMMMNSNGDGRWEVGGGWVGGGRWEVGGGGDNINNIIKKKKGMQVICQFLL